MQWSPSRLRDWAHGLRLLTGDPDDMYALTAGMANVIVVAI